MEDFHISNYSENCDEDSEDTITNMDDENDNFVTPRENLTIADMTNHNRELECRMNKLKDTMSTLKRQLLNESDFWKNEVKSHLYSDTDFKNNSEYYTTNNSESNLGSTFSSMISLNSNKEFEKRSINHQFSIQAAREEKRNEVRRQIALAAYKEKLMEVEKMCNLELSRVKQNVKFLQPLKMMASEWNNTTSLNTMSSGDASHYYFVGQKENNKVENRHKTYNELGTDNSPQEQASCQ